MRKRLLSTLLSLCAMLTMLPINTLTAEQTPSTKISDPTPSSRAASGVCGQNAAWKLENGTLTISGSGEMDSYFYNPNAPDDDSDPACKKAPWYSMRDQIHTAVITDGISSIGMSAFFDCSNLTDVAIPDSVQIIDAYAFSGCGSLVNITLPNSITDIQPYTFDGCVNLTKVTIPNSVTEICMGAFEGCSSLTSITLPKSLTSIDDNSFSYCSNLSAIKIPDGVTIISPYAFAYCVKLKSATIPRSVEYIRWDAFTQCYELADVYYGGSENEWESISIDEENEILEQAFIHFNGSDTSTFKNVYYYDTIAKTGVNVDLSWNWNDLLKGDSSIYNERLAQMGVALSAAIEGSAEDVGRILLYNLECDDVQYMEGISPDMAIGIKEVKNKYGTEYIIFIVLRGTTTGGDVLNDIFSALKITQWGVNPVSSGLESRLSEWSGTYGEINENNTKFFVTGHSLGGACANLLAERLNRGYGEENVFGYTFAAPSPLKELGDISRFYGNIYNFLCFQDAVPLHYHMRDKWCGYGYPRWFGMYEQLEVANKYQELTGKIWWDTYKENNYGLLDTGLLGCQLHAPSAYMAYLKADPTLKNSFIIAYTCSRCPVDIEVYNSDNTLVGRIVNDEIDYSCSNPEISLIVCDGAKYVYFLNDDTYTVKIIGTGDGTMTYTAATKDMNTDIDEETQVYSNVKISTDKKFRSVVSSYDKTNTNNLVEIPDVELLVTDDSGNAIAQVLPDSEASSLEKDNGTEIPIKTETTLDNKLSDKLGNNGKTIIFYICLAAATGFLILLRFMSHRKK